MIFCEQCGEKGIDLPCPKCGWEGQEIDKAKRMSARNMPLFSAGTVLIVLGALVAGSAACRLALVPALLGAGVAALGFKLLAKSRGG